ncbi:MAG: hypothetical protein RL030_1754 [Pseudomonadota bacterium]|jgi:hypothetical protein
MSHPEDDRDEDPRPGDRAREYADASPNDLMMALATLQRLPDGQWINWGAAAQKLLRGEDCTADELIVVMFNAFAAVSSLARHALLDMIRATPDYQRTVATYLRETEREIAAEDADDLQASQEPAP